MTENKTAPVPATRQRSAPYPRFNLQQVEKFAKVVFEEGPRNCDQDIVAKKAGYSGSNNGSFFAMRSAASQFGLVIAKNERISVTEEWVRAFHEDTTESLRAARQLAIRKPGLYGRLFDTFADHQLPAAEKLARTIYLDDTYGVTKEAALEAVKTFIESAQYAGILDEKNYLRAATPVVLPAADDSLGDPDDNYDQPSMFRDADVSRITTRLVPPRSTPNTVKPQTVIQDGTTLSIPADMEKQELTFRGGKKAYFIMPVPLPKGEKARLNKWLEVIKMQIELTLEDDPEPPAYTSTDDSSV